MTHGAPGPSSTGSSRTETVNTDTRSTTAGAPAGTGEEITGATAARERRTPTGTDLALVVVFAALLAVLSLAPPIPVGPAGVPITLQTLGVGLAGAVLGSRRGAAAVLLYLVVGLIGVPVFAGFTGGPAVLAGPSAGYLVAFPIAAWVIGFFTERIRTRTWALRTLLVFVVVAVSSLVVVHGLGILGLVLRAHLAPGAAVLADLVFVPGDLLKAVVVALVASTVHRAFPVLRAGR